MRREDSSEPEAAFTLIELMVVVLIVAILLAIAIPTFLGAREKASNRAVQAQIRNAPTTEMVFFADKQEFTASKLELDPLDANIQWTNTLTDLPLSSNLMYVELTAVNGRQAVVIGGKSQAGRCFWLRSVRDQNQPRFADNDCVASPDVNAYSESW
jgi:type IV pilus assembly protein PilA